MKRLASIREAAATVGVKRDTIARWIRAGKLEATTQRAGRFVVRLVDLAAVERLAQAIRRGRPPTGGRR